jgi:hypothetical protein
VIDVTLGLRERAARARSVVLLGINMDLPSIAFSPQPGNEGPAASPSAADPSLPR